MNGSALPRLKDLDWPTCLDYFEFDYYDIVYNESTYMKTFSRPFPPFHQVMEFELRSDKIPCSEEYAFITRVRKLTIQQKTCYVSMSRCLVRQETSPSPHGHLHLVS